MPPDRRQIIHCIEGSDLIDLDFGHIKDTANFIHSCPRNPAAIWRLSFGALLPDLTLGQIQEQGLVGKDAPAAEPEAPAEPEVAADATVDAEVAAVVGIPAPDVRQDDATR